MSADSDLILEIFSRLDNLDERFHDRLAASEKRLSAEISELHDCVEKRISNLESKTQEHTEKIIQHDHYAKIVLFVVSGGLAGFFASFNWLSSLFKG